MASGNIDLFVAQAAPRLTRWGLSPLADLVYRILAGAKALSTDEICSALDVSRRQASTALDELQASRLATADPHRLGRTNDVSWRAVEPTTAVARLKERQLVLARERVRAAQRLTTLSDLGLDPADPHLFPRGTLRPVFGLAQAQGRIAELADMTQQESLSMYPDRAVSAHVIKGAAAADRSTLNRGVSTLMLSVPSDSTDESGAHGAHLRSLGAHKRELPDVPMRLILMDRTTAIIRLNPADPAEGIWEITARPAVERLVNCFLKLWARANPSVQDWIPPLTLSARERAIVALLAAGHTDSTVAETLDLSVRTIAYTVSSLMDKYEVKTRFQLGLVLGAEAQSGEQRVDTTEHSDTGYEGE